jgi:membrane protease YdiL (CAAX protease family)
VLWTAVLLLLRRSGSFDLGEAATSLVILGVVLPLLALLATRRALPLPSKVRRPAAETAFLLVYLLVMAWILVSGFGEISRLTAEPLHSLALLAAKLAVFVLIPAAVIRSAGNYRIADLVPLSFRPRDLRPALWMALAFLLMQSVLGRGLRDIQAAHLPAWGLAVAVPLSFAWLLIEVGVVEEFFFRVLLQDRLAALLRSPWGGLVVSALLFGLVHAPGFYLRTAASQESLGLHPSLFMAIGYSIVITSLAGFALGVLWMRTKNFAVIVIVHAAADLLPNLVPWARAFRLAH